MIFDVQNVKFNQSDIDLGHQVWWRSRRGSVVLASYFLQKHNERLGIQG